MAETVIGLVAHLDKPGAREAVGSLADELDRRKADYLIEEGTAELVPEKGAGLPLAEMARRCGLLVVLGGDGSILRVVHRVNGDLPPIFGINIGSLGFLTCLGPQEYREAVDSILAGSYVLSRRTLLEVRHEGRNGALTWFGLNDVVISRGERSQLVRLRVLIDGEELTEYYADGLIVSTPTGSTAYSLSSGGPILMPDSGVFVITPICPHVLTNRSVVVADSAAVRIELSRPGQQVFVNVDGQEELEMREGDMLAIGKAARELRLAMLPGRSFSQVLRQKLKWTGTNV